MSAAPDQRFLWQLLRARTVAIIGASGAPHKAGGRRWLSAISETPHPRLFPVTLGTEPLNGHRTYRSLSEVPEPVDLAVVMVPAAAVKPAIEDCAASGAGAIVVISAGFAETGAAGRALEAELAAIARRGGGRLLGPNSAGVYSAAGGINVLGWPVPKGPIGLITQSGNVALTFTHMARAKQVGFSAILAPGNGADLRISDLLRLLLDEPATRSILIYCEGLAENDGRRLVEVMQGAKARKPIVMLKAGTSEAGSRAVQSHTGALADDDRLADGILGSAGIIRARETEEAFDLALALATPMALDGRDIALLSDGGGHATIVADCAGRHGLRLATFAPATVERLRALLPARSGIENPIDFAGLAESQPASVPEAIEACLADPNVRGVIFAGHFGGYHLMTGDEPTRARVAEMELQAARRMAAAAAAAGKPFIMHSEHAERGVETLRPIYEAGIPLYAGLESAARAMAALGARTRPAGGRHGRDIRRDAEGAARGNQAARPLLEPEARERLARAGLPLAPFRTVATASEAQAAFEELGGPVAMKLVSAKAPHKSDVGGVILDVDSAESAAAAGTRLIALARDLGADDARMLMSPMIGEGVECLIGGTVDRTFGPVISFGAGGVLVELIGDVSFRLAPVDETQAREMIEGSRIFPLLSGYRGRKPVDLAALVALLTAASRYLAATPGLCALDLNPVIVNRTGAHIADVRIVEADDA